MASPDATGTPATTINGEVAGTTHTINLPTDESEGDLCVVAICYTRDTGEAPATMTQPANWTEVYEGSAIGAADGPRLGIWYRAVPAGGLDATADWEASDAGSDSIAVAGLWSGADTSEEDVVGNATGGPDQAPTCPDETTTVADTVVLRIFGCDDDDAAADGGYPGGTTGVGVAEAGNTAGNGCSVAMAYETQAGAGSTGTAAFSLDASEHWDAVTLAFGPSEAASGNPWYAYAQQ